MRIFQRQRLRVVFLVMLAIGAWAVHATEPVAIDARPFPRQFTSEGVAFAIHEPQLDSWQDEMLKGRFAMSVKTGTHKDANGKTVDSLQYGVVEFSARTDTDKPANKVILRQVDLRSATFPTAPNEQAHYLELARNVIKSGTVFTLDLDRLRAALVFAASSRETASYPVRNVPPDIIFEFTPAVLIMVDGEPALKPVGDAGVQRVINTQSLLFMQNGRYYTKFAGHWALAETLAGPWAEAINVDAALTAAAQTTVEADLGDGGDATSASSQALFANGAFPVVLVSTRPASLIVVDGEPRFDTIAGTGLSYVVNTGADVFVEESEGHTWFVLISGRWFSAPGSKGPWAYVAPNRLPAGFAKIPPANAKSAVLGSIPGTPEARESLIANSIPQTATVNRTTTKLTVTYDGAPQFKPIDGTALQYAWNTPMAVIRVSADSFYSVDKGIWFTSHAATGPWQVATSVPDAIYSIPTSSSLHYVTYVRIYGSQNDNIFVGYTPGYYGTVVTPSNTVVYGTGYGCTPWVGAYWYGCPATYGMGAVFGWDAWMGWTFGFGWGGYGGWYGPAGPWWGPWSGMVYPYGWWGGGAAAWNAYGHWGNSVVSGIGAAWANPWTGNYGRGFRGGYFNQATGGRGYGRAAINTNAYTGTTRAAAQGMRYNPQTGRAVAGTTRAVANPYTGQRGSASDRTVANTNTGQVTHMQGAHASGPQGAAGVGSFDSNGRNGNVRGAGGYSYNADTGTLNRGGAVNVDGNVFAGHDGNVYHYNNGNWNQLTRPDGGGGLGGGLSSSDMANLNSMNNDFAARQGGMHSGFGDGGFGGGGFGDGGFHNGDFGGGFDRPSGGFHDGLGSPSFGGSFGGFHGGFGRR